VALRRTTVMVKLGKDIEVRVLSEDARSGKIFLDDARIKYYIRV